ncbi:MAG: hypothetical protein DSZ08_00380 [Sulfurovum sp.]|nr:MAG: hypothetical protein DSZ08_00380 [Sulfurovum sp.]
MKLKILLCSAFIAHNAMAVESNTTQEGVKYIKMLGSALKTELQSHMKNDPSGLEALSFCTGSAQSITQKINAKLPKYAKVRRTALKVRNHSNKPDATDIKVIQTYTKAIASKTFHADDIKTIIEGNTTRVYKPLLAQKVCLKCHGSTLSPQIKNALHSAYPKDEAVGYKEGDLRGVIVSEIKKH